ncbi:uncharacterized protein LAESUDRAFT_644049 [Laetiporus sulphureus 93-53]|uniref:DUF6570 domain-containing protein n=1 Tax=Laetiporus sulphureus 93-53 TaxID=1314785 RepID=A0A165GT34_9APHY|nr:uncharacterized protein LAESUDRAFT_644049 [Laetiporus sulphureus 93-53]KZT10773.1 hypothetical protein LAESUDRAFT_644049 [Laetiporus sulphureus 93-53]
MIADAIAFSQPVEKIYDVLPPPRRDLDDVLAILFTGPCRPNEDDFKRTPLLVRPFAVVAALDWLLLNHSDYGGVSISHANLSEYPEHEPPVTVLRRGSDGSTPAESMSVHEVDEERGTTEGPCPFVVHGLSAADVATMSYKPRIVTALQYFHGGGAVLGYGHSAKPESIYHNSSLLPGMFPWLFPYNLGGLENVLLKAHIHRTAHIRSSLSLYSISNKLGTPLEVVIY